MKIIKEILFLTNKGLYLCIIIKNKLKTNIMKSLTNLKQIIAGKTYNVYCAQGASRKTYFVRIGNVYLITSKKECI